MPERRRHTHSTRHRTRVTTTPGRRDIQGLRAFAMLTIFATHLLEWPRGGFVTLDVFFVISGFLITGNLLRSAETHGTVPFKKFYWNRVRRIIPAATVVLLLTYLVSTLIFKAFRAHEVGIDALFAFIFMANWRYAYQGTDYFQNAAQTVSPLQHYWSLSVEEQFYFVWPAVIFVVSLLVLRRSWSHQRRMQLAGGAMCVIIAASFAWAMYKSATSPAWAYFDTFTRVWELGVGALLATAVGLLARIPTAIKPALSWGGLAVIVASIALITDPAMGFPAPWALLPVAGSAMVIAAGVGGEPAYQFFLRNRVSTYLGDMSYSLYLVHWPVIIILGTLMARGSAFYFAAVTCTFGLSIASYHFVENPLRRADSHTFKRAKDAITDGRIRVKRSSQYAALGAAALLTIGLCTYAVRPEAYRHNTPMADAQILAANASAPEPRLGPLGLALEGELDHALKATEWPELEPSMESVIGGSLVLPEINRCAGVAEAPADLCAWGSSSAPVRVVLVGDSIALGYAGALREIALNSRDQIQFHNFAMGSCAFIDNTIDRPGLSEYCEGRKQNAVDFINATNPTVVIVANQSTNLHVAGTHDLLTPKKWADSLNRMLQKFQQKPPHLVFIAPPPSGPPANECFAKRSSTPADCIGQVDKAWQQMATAEQQLADALGAAWIDSRPWFCNAHQLCPAFAGTSPTKYGAIHMAPTYATKIYPVMSEVLHQEGIL
ncbi:hypothetical protein A5630_07295 [Mycolicibacterium mucogenicum]|uniref:Acyltransferase n=1 Tax=Mycolicibacterium mucogenicum TaxID=56689 RepID=A0A1A3GJH1_MYCMU|nr:acyltransferase family protein [Mycolicibacterium mucogenicum]OBJ36192.1 hypothetical protein A5630_07295 [Mycolicibacterium mucogenicum]